MRLTEYLWGLFTTWILSHSTVAPLFTCIPAWPEAIWVVVIAVATWAPFTYPVSVTEVDPVTWNLTVYQVPVLRVALPVAKEV
jgi:hypothetical protein